MSIPIDASLCRLTSSLKKVLLCGYSLDNVYPIHWGLHHEPVAVNQYKVPRVEVIETNVFVVLGILQVCLKLCSESDFPVIYRAFVRKYIKNSSE